MYPRAREWKKRSDKARAHALFGDTGRDWVARHLHQCWLRLRWPSPALPPAGLDCPWRLASVCGLAAGESRVTAAAASALRREWTRKSAPLWKGKPPPHAGGIPLLFWQGEKKKELLPSLLPLLPLASTFTASLSQLPFHNSLSSTSSFPVVVDLLRHLCEEPGQRDCRAQRTGESSRERTSRASTCA